MALLLGLPLGLPPSSLAAQIFTCAERVWSNSYHHLVSNKPRISWGVNWVSEEWRGAVAFFGMLFRERGVIMKDLLLQNTSQFMFTSTSLDALLLSLQYKKPDGNLTRLSPLE